MMNNSKPTNDELSEIAVNIYEKYYIASLVSLMAGIHHEIKSPLQSIEGAIEVLNFFAENLQTNVLDHKDCKFEHGINNSDIEVIKECVLIINHSQTRICEVLEMLSLSNKEYNKNNLCKINIRNFIDDVVNSLVYLTEFKNTTININMHVHDIVPKDIYIIPSFLKNILINLLCNSCNAIVCHQISNGNIDIYLTIRKGKLIWDIADNGCGIKEIDNDKVFDPFFTRRLAKNSTGLGLFICRSMVKKMGGDIRVRHSEPGFTIINFDINFEESMNKN